MGSSKRSKDKKDKKEKKEKKEKRKRHDDSDDSDPDREARKVLRRMEKEHKQRLTGSVALDEPADNAFGDRNLGDKFFWKKKVEKEVKTGKLVALDAQTSAAKDRERAMELERVKLRREMNEAEFVRRQEEVGKLEHARLVADAVQEAAKEEQFHLKQAVSRARRRLDERRAQPIDELIRFLWLQGSHPSSPTVEPSSVFEDMRPGELRQLMEDVEMLKALDVEDPSHAAYWSSIYFHLDWKLNEDVEADNADREAVRAGSAATAVHDSVKGEIEAMFAGQSYSELLELEQAVESTLGSPDCTDPEFWLAVKSRLGLAKARTRCREIYRMKVQEALLQRREQGGQEDVGAGVSGAGASEARRGEATQPSGGEADAGARADDKDGDEAPSHDRQGEEPPSEDESDEDAALPEWLQQSDGRFSPPPLTAELVAGQDVVHEDEDREQLRLLRQLVAEQQRRQRLGVLRLPAATASVGVGAGVHPALAALTDGDADTAATAAARRHALRVMGESAEGEVAFGGEVPLESQEYYWQEKYRPRKPKFFNRVHTGYDWNKYNRVHYDVDNPPPKVVQGYKFNIFYPDLIDKSKAPTYRVVDDPQCQDDTMCLLVFEAGPPYEDVAFRIVKKEWEHSHKKGFKNVFERDVLHLYFNFKRNPYRR